MYLAEQPMGNAYPETCSVQKDFRDRDLPRQKQGYGDRIDSVNAAVDGKIAKHPKQDQPVDGAVETERGVHDRYPAERRSG